MSYHEFIASKRRELRPVGFDVAASDVNPHAFDWQSDIIRWAVRRGRACLFADCGLGKSLMQLDWARHVASQTGGDVLILAPLSVARQTRDEGAKFGIDVTVCRDGADVRPGINVTNYDRIHRFDTTSFSGVVLDESSIIKSQDGKTRALIMDAFAPTRYRLACTATPAPNDFMELGNHAEFVGAMSQAEMLSTYFVHDGGETQKWRLKGHAVDDFWRWVTSWACLVRRPSDLGYSDDGFILPPLTIRERVVEAKASEGDLFPMVAETLQDRIKARRSSIDERVAATAEEVNSSSETWTIWCNLNAESAALANAIPGSVEVSGSDSSEVKEDRMMAFSRGETRVLITKPKVAGFGMNWQHCNRVAFVGLSDSWESYYQAVRRSWRFGQKKPVDVLIVTAETEGAVVANIKRKDEQASEMAEAIASQTKARVREAIKSTSRDFDSYSPQETMEVPSWLMPCSLAT